jgi:hypothetical protein
LAPAARSKMCSPVKGSLGDLVGDDVQQRDGDQH